MSNDATKRAEDLLDQIRDRLPFKVNEVTQPDEQDSVIATVRGADGYPILAPHPEAMSLLVGNRVIFELLVFSPSIIEDLLAENAALRAEKKAETK